MDSQHQDHKRPTEISIHIDGKLFKATKTPMTGAEIKALGNVPANLKLFKKIPGAEPDEPIGDGESVDLHEGDHFYSLPPGRVGGRLPSVEHEIEEAKTAYPGARVIDGVGGEFYFVVPGVALPSKAGWNTGHTDVMVPFPASYPQARPGNLFVRPGLARANAAPGGLGGLTNIGGEAWYPLCWSPQHSEEARKTVLACVRFALSRFNEAQ